jgi:DNA-binding transcriptional MerR regulator
LAKSAEAFRTISEAADELGVAQHVLRFWETKFSFIRPMKRAGGRRFYRPADIVVLATVRRLLHQEGYTIKGVQKLHREQGLKTLLTAERPVRATAVVSTAPAPTVTPSSDDGLKAALSALEAAKARLDALLFRA